MGPTLNRDDERLKAAVGNALLERDRSVPAPPLARVWPGERQRPQAMFQRPAFAAVAALLAVAGVSWLVLERRGQVAAPPADLRATVELAEQLSSPDYWRVPTDDLLVYAATPPSAELPSPEGFEVSLEESLL